MSVEPGEHWFDRLSRPYSRRRALKVALAGGVALALPNLRLPRASAATRPPCFATCRDLAIEDWRIAGDACNQTGFLKGAMLYLFYRETVLDCYARNQVAFRRDWLACYQPECGDPGKYPGGNKPRTVCTPNEETQCGDICCNVVTDCCLNKRTGEYQCCARIPGGVACDCAK
jgi:hypothetical protein